jgi:hypothetical protein
MIMLCSSIAGAAVCGCSRAVAAGHAVVMACARRWRSSMIAAAFASMVAAVELSATFASVVAAVELGTWAEPGAPLAPGGGEAGETMTGALVPAGGALWTSATPLGACCRTLVASFATPRVGDAGGDSCGELAGESTVPVLDACVVAEPPVFVVVAAVDGPASVPPVLASWVGCVPTTAEEDTSSPGTAACARVANVIATPARIIATTTTAAAPAIWTFVRLRRRVAFTGNIFVGKIPTAGYLDTRFHVIARWTPLISHG